MTLVLITQSALRNEKKKNGIKISSAVIPFFFEP